MVDMPVGDQHVGQVLQAEWKSKVIRDLPQPGFQVPVGIAVTGAGVY